MDVNNIIEICLMGTDTASGPTHESRESSLAKAFTSVSTRMRGIARRMLGNDDDADDAIQETFCRLWNARDRITRPEAASVTTLRNVCVDMLRRDSHMSATDIDTLPPQQQATTDNDPPPDDELITRVNAIIDTRLSPLHREILLHRDRDGWSIDDLATHYSLTPVNIRVILSRSRRIVRDIFNNQKL